MRFWGFPASMGTYFARIASWISQFDDRMADMLQVFFIILSLCYIQQCVLQSDGVVIQNNFNKQHTNTQMDPEKPVQQKQAPIEPNNPSPNSQPQPQPQKSQSQKQAQMLLHEEQQKMIRQQIEAESPLIGDLFPLAMLMDQFVNNQGFYIKIQGLMNQYAEYRKTRRDGSCFYRAINYCVFERIVVKGDKGLRDKMVDKIKKAKEHLLKAGFEGIVFQDLQQIFLQKLQKNLPKNREQLLNLFRDPEQSNVLILMLRFITSGQIRNNAILYETFIDDQIPAEHYCQLEVEPIDKEADQIPIMALLNYLEIGIRIVYLDSNHANKEAYKVILPESWKESDIVGELLYRPGHYDILYR